MYNMFGVSHFLMFTSFSETLGKTSMLEDSTCWARSSTCQKRDKIQMRSELRQQLSSCLLDLVVVHIFFSLLKKVHGEFFWSAQKSIWGPSLPFATYLHFRWIGVGVVVGEAGQELPVIPFLPLGRKRDVYNLCFSPQQIHRRKYKSRWAWKRK